MTVFEMLKIQDPGMVPRDCNPSIQEAEVRSLRVQGQPMLQIKTLSQTKLKESVEIEEMALADRGLDRHRSP